MNKNQDDNPIYSIGTVSRMLEISVETIRLYERRGLMLASRSDGRQRIYSEADVERLRCIRAAINEHKISIEGIRRIQSLIPCWEHMQCSPEHRHACPAYRLSQAGCWTYKHTENACAERECRTCQVYRLSSDCENIKALIHHKAEPGFFPLGIDQEGFTP
jgi:MerR family transcriptional regulator/heat shock protein HspR